MNELFGWRLPFGDWVNEAKDWLISTLSFLWLFIRDIIQAAYDHLASILNQPSWWLVVLAGGLLVGYAVRQLFGPRSPFWQVGLGVSGLLLAIDGALWAVEVFGDGGVALRETLGGPYDLFDPLRPSFLLMFVPPSLVMIALLAAIGWVVRGWLFGLGAGASLLLIDLVGLWPRTMDTLAMVLVACGIAVAVAIPIGIAAAQSRAVSTVVKPVLDLMQTLPALVYLVIAVALFRVGIVPGIIATIVFSMPPAIRLTELGIRQVDAEVVEAGHAFGSPPNKILRQIQLPLATPTIMAGVNQVIMLALAMVVLAGIAGGGALGQTVVQGIARLDLGLALEAGLAVVILAVYLDRTTAALGARSRIARLEKVA